MKKKEYGSAILTGVVIGVGAWLAYAAVEFILYSIAPLFLLAEAELNAPIWRIAAITVAIYITIGALLGALASFALLPFGRADNRRMLRSIVTLQFLAIFSANLFADGTLAAGEQVSLAAAGIAIVAGLACLFSEHWDERAGFLIDPLTTVVFVMIPAWISMLIFVDRSVPFRLGVILPVLLGVALLAWAFSKRRLPLWTTPGRYAAAMAVLLLTAGGTGSALSAGSGKLPPRQSAPSGNQPNVVLIVMDTVRADHTSLYGYERDTTPFLRELARESVVYKNAIAVSDMTLPTHASMFTGLYPQTHGAHYAPPTFPWGRPLAEKFTTLAEVLSAHGYRTIAEVANSAFVAPRMGLQQGFEVFDWRFPALADGSARRYSHLRKTVVRLIDPIIPMMEAELAVRRAGEVNREVYRLLDQVGAHSPFFLFVNYMDAHVPYVPPEPFRSAYPCSDPGVARFDKTEQISYGTLSRKRAITREERRCLESYYDAGIVYMDAQLRNLVTNLKARGKFENTLFIVTSDHGEAFGVRNLVGHGGISVYQEEIGIPLLVKYPGHVAGSEIDVRASQVDLLPTVLDVANLPPMPNLAGVSLQKIAGANARALVSASYPDTMRLGRYPAFQRLEEALVYGPMKLVVSTFGKREMYELSADQAERTNLYREGDPRTDELVAMLARWKRSVPAAQAGGTSSGDRGTMDRLKSLGYVQ